MCVILILVEKGEIHKTAKTREHEQHCASVSVSVSVRPGVCLALGGHSSHSIKRFIHSKAIHESQTSNYSAGVINGSEDSACTARYRYKPL